jgi:hypothetical protein
MKRMIAVLVVVAGLALVASADGPAVASVDVARARALALDAIKAKHPATDPSGLQYTGLTVTSSTNDQIVVTVNFLVTDSGTTENVEKDGRDMTKKKQTTYIVQMGTGGEIKDVSTGSTISIQSISRKKAANQPSEATR